MSVFDEKIKKDKVLKLKVNEEDLNRIADIEKRLKLVDDSKEFNLDDKLHLALINLLNQADKELIKIEKQESKTQTTLS